VNDGTGLAEALLGLSEFRVLPVSEILEELVVEIETATEQEACRSCGGPSRMRDLPFRAASSVGVAQPALALRRSPTVRPRLGPRPPRTSRLEGRADIRHIAELLGHSRLETTQRYTRVSIHQLRQVHALTHPGANLPDRVAAPTSSPT